MNRLFHVLSSTAGRSQSGRLLTVSVSKISARARGAAVVGGGVDDAYVLVVIMRMMFGERTDNENISG